MMVESASMDTGIAGASARGPRPSQRVLGELVEVAQAHGSQPDQQRLDRQRLLRAVIHGDARVQHPKASELLFGRQVPVPKTAQRQRRV
jgi:hypothetical protein